MKGKQINASPEHRDDPYLIQRLALATYQTKQPDDASTVKALNEALDVLAPLRPFDSNDPETVGLAGAIEKRLFDKGQGLEHLSLALRHYSRGYHLRDYDYYNGINLAYLLNVRVESALDTTDADRIADLVVANRIRREILPICDRELKLIEERREHGAEARAAGVLEAPGSRAPSDTATGKRHSGVSPRRPRPALDWARPKDIRQPARWLWGFSPRRKVDGRLFQQSDRSTQSSPREARPPAQPAVAQDRFTMNRAKTFMDSKPVTSVDSSTLVVATPRQKPRLQVATIIGGWIVANSLSGTVMIWLLIGEYLVQTLTGRPIGLWILGAWWLPWCLSFAGDVFGGMFTAAMARHDRLRHVAWTGGLVGVTAPLWKVLGAVWMFLAFYFQHPSATLPGAGFLRP